MFGFLVGTACVVGLFAMARRRRRWARGYGYGYGHGPHSHWHHHGFRGGPAGGWNRYGDGWGGPPTKMAGFIASRIEASPEQYKVIRDELETFFETTRPLRREFRLSRDDIAKAMRTESFDEEIMGESFARQDEQMTELRKALVGALARIHDALDDRQRARLASLVESGPFGRRGPSWM